MNKTDLVCMDVYVGDKKHKSVSEKYNERLRIT